MLKRRTLHMSGGEGVGVRGLWEQVGAVDEGLEGGGRSVPSVLKAGGLPLSPAPRVRDRPWRRSGPSWAYLSLWRLSDPLHQPRARWDDGGSRGQDEGLPGLWCGEEDGPGSETKGAVQERPGCRALVRSATLLPVGLEGQGVAETLGDPGGSPQESELGDRGWAVRNVGWG